MRARQVPVRETARLFAALGDLTRLQLVTRLSSQGPRSIALLQRRSNVTRQAITKHLEVLSNAGLVRSSRRGRERIWELTPRRLADASEYIERISREWDVALQRLTSFVENDIERDSMKRTS